MLDVPGSDRFVRIDPIKKGQSGDKKFRAVTDLGKIILVRIADSAQYERKRAEYDMLARAASAGVPAPRPLDFGLCKDGRHTYALMSWCEGIDAECLLPALSPDAQYALGVKSGALLKSLHALPAPDRAESWGVRFQRKIEGRFNSLSGRSKEGDLIVSYLQDNHALLGARPQTFNHGDFNPGNLIVDPNGVIRAIDFNAYNSGFGDPWWEIAAVNPGEQACAPYLTGQIHGYFDADPPPAFFPMCAFYAAYGALAALCDAATGECAPGDGARHLANVLAWFDGMRRTVPAWYHPLTSPSV